MEPGEVADMLAFCASPRAGYLSGTIIDLTAASNTPVELGASWPRRIRAQPR